MRREVFALPEGSEEAKVHRTRAVLGIMPSLLVELWRELHPKGHEQVVLNFHIASPAAISVPLR